MTTYVSVAIPDEEMRLRRRWTILLILAFWAFAFAMLTIRALLVDSPSFNLIGPRRLLTALFGAALCLGMVRLLGALGSRAFAVRIGWGLTGAFVMSVAVTLFGTLMNRVLFPLPGMLPLSFGETAQWVLVWYGYFLAWTGTHLALTYHWAVQDHEGLSSRLAVATQRAELAALRYQLNPHFLFNSFNSVSSLVMEDRKQDAELMLLNLAEFVRAALVNGPSGRVRLGDEMELQRVYLEIEKTRFGERLDFEFDVPDDLRAIQVPALILQPLVENAVRHGVDRTEDPVIIRLQASADNGLIRLQVADDARADGGAKRVPGSGVGLANIRQRLKLEYGVGAKLDAGPIAGGGYAASISIPARCAV